MEQFKGVVNSLPQEVKDKIQIVLCGYDLRGTIQISKSNIVQTAKTFFEFCCNFIFFAI